jgi:hypothetical protein
MVQTFAVDSRLPIPDGMAENDPTHPKNVMRDAAIVQNQAIADTKYDPYPPPRISKEESERQEKEKRKEELRRKGGSSPTGKPVILREFIKQNTDLIDAGNTVFYRIVKTGTGPKLSGNSALVNLAMGVMHEGDEKSPRFEMKDQKMSFNTNHGEEDKTIKNIIKSGTIGSIYEFYTPNFNNNIDSTTIYNTIELLSSTEGFATQFGAEKTSLFYPVVFGLVFLAVFLWKQGKGRGFLKGRARLLAIMVIVAIVGLVVYRIVAPRSLF